MGYTKVIFNLPDETVEELKKLSGDENICSWKTTDTIVSAINTYDFLVKKAEQGFKIVLKPKFVWWDPATWSMSLLKFKK